MGQPPRPAVSYPGGGSKGRTALSSRTVDAVHSVDVSKYRTSSNFPPVSHLEKRKWSPEVELANSKSASEKLGPIEKPSRSRCLQRRKSVPRPLIRQLAYLDGHTTHEKVVTKVVTSVAAIQDKRRAEDPVLPELTIMMWTNRFRCRSARDL